MSKLILFRGFQLRLGLVGRFKTTVVGKLVGRFKTTKSRNIIG